MNAQVKIHLPEHARIRKMVAGLIVGQQKPGPWSASIGGCDDYDMVPLDKMLPGKNTSSDSEFARLTMRDTGAGSPLEPAA